MNADRHYKLETFLFIIHQLFYLWIENKDRNKYNSQSAVFDLLAKVHAHFQSIVYTKRLSPGREYKMSSTDLNKKDGDNDLALSSKTGEYVD